MKYILLSLPIFLFASCADYQWRSDKCELRQLVSKEVETSSTHGSFFLIVGSYSSSTQKEDVIKMFAKVDGNYRLISCPLEDVRICINDSVTVPYIVAWDNGRNAPYKPTNEQIFNSYYGNKYTITCPSKYLPERLLEIDITK